MFVKKDLRKIPQILEDATSRAVAAPPSGDNDPARDDAEDSGGGIVEEMRFARRAPEFLPSRDASPLLGPRHRPALDSLVRLSLYDCGLNSLAGIELSRDGEMRAPLFPKLEQLDVGRNPLENASLPQTFHTQFPSLAELWLDDCRFGPFVPTTLLEIDGLRVARMTGNRLEGELDDGIGARHWRLLKILALDGNRLSGVGRGLGELGGLEKLHLGRNELESLPEGVPGGGNSSLVMLGLSSNRLSSLPASLADCLSLEELYLNSNRIGELPEGLAGKLLRLRKLNLAHNSIGKSGAAGSQGGNSADGADEIMADASDGDQSKFQLPRDFVRRFGAPEPLSGNCTEDGPCIVRMEGNPLTEAIRKEYLEEEKRKEREMAMEAVEAI